MEAILRAQGRGHEQQGCRPFRRPGQTTVDEHLARAGLTGRDAPQDRGSRRLAEWVSELPKPAGVMACYDIRGRELIDACRAAEVEIPDEVAVVGLKGK